MTDRKSEIAAWLLVWQSFQEVLMEAPVDTSLEDVAAFALEMRSRCPYWPPPAEAMTAIQNDWLLHNPGEPLPPGLFGATHGLWVAGTT